MVGVEKDGSLASGESEGHERIRGGLEALASGKVYSFDVGLMLSVLLFVDFLVLDGSDVL